MAIQSFEILPESRFNACVIEPGVIGEHEKFPAEITERQALEKQWFKPGQHGCPHCMAEELHKAGEYEAAGWFFDSSNWSERELSPGQSLRFESAITALRRNNLFTDGRFHPRLETKFVSTARPSSAAPSGRKPSYRHSKEFSGLCRSREDSEHEGVIDLVATKFKAYLLGLYPSCQVTHKFNRRVADAVNRRPDIDYHIQGDTSEGPVDFRMVVEVQKSWISGPSWQGRNAKLKEASDFVIWVFKQSRSGATFKPMLTVQVEAGEPAYVYDIAGEPGSSDCNLILTPAAQGYPHFWGVNQATPTGTGNPVCQNPTYRQKKSAAEVFRSRVSPQSHVEFGGFGTLARVLPGLSPKARAEELAKVSHDKPAAATHALRPNTWAFTHTPKPPTPEYRQRATVQPFQAPIAPPAAEAVTADPSPAPEKVLDLPVPPAPAKAKVPEPLWENQVFTGWAGIPPWMHH